MESPAMVPTASGRNRASSMLSEASATKSPLDVIEARKSGPCPGRGVDSLTVIARMSGTTARMPKPAWLRRRPKISRSSERRKRVETCRSGRAAGEVASSAADIEALPGERHEQVFKAGLRDGKPGHGHTLMHQRSDDLVRDQRAQSPHHHTGFDNDIGQAESAQHGCRIRRSVSLHPGPWLADCPHLGDGPLGQQPADMHHPDVGAHLLNLGQEMADDGATV